MGDLLDKFSQLQELRDMALALIAWLGDNVFVLAPLLQLLSIGVALLVARMLAPRIEFLLETAKPPKGFETAFGHATRFLKPLALPVVWIVLLWFSQLVAANAGWSFQVLESGVSLLTAWIIIRMATFVVADPGWSRAITVIAWSIAALNIVGLLDPTIEILDSMAIQFGEVHVSVLGVGKALVVLGVLLWLAGASSSLLEKRIARASSLSPSVQVLFGKLMKIVLFSLAFVLALNSVGIDLTALAVFSGAVGLGIGFGLQKVVSNLLSGVILLLDKSVKPGDVIAIGDTYGWINSLSARYVSVITRDGTEHLIPNEELISQKVENWSYTNRLVRQRMPIGVSYASDVRKAIALAIEAAAAEGRVLDDPLPVCHLKGFGDSAVDLELRFWLRDPQNGLSNIKNLILLRIWDLYHENGIEFPFPQRDLNVRGTVPVRIED
ncbi:MAG: mechanosensitive ion channel family protein [Alphaproteobacteria bacterium]